MDLSDLRRSTLFNGNVSGDARLALEEVINDIKHLDWKECHVTSLLTQGVDASATSTSTATATSCNTVSVKLRRSKRRKTSKQAGVGPDLSVNSSGTTVAAGSTAAIC